MSLGRAVATVGGFTLLSRVVGFVRDIVLSAVLGSGAVADALLRRLQAAELLPPPVRRGRLLGRLRAAVRARAAGPRPRRRRWPSRARPMPRCCWCCVPFSLLLMLAHAAGDGAAGARPARRRADLRHGRRVRPHHLSLSAVHLAGLALWRRAEQHRPLRPCRGHADPAQPRADRRGAGPRRRCCPTAAMPPRSASAIAGLPAMAVAADRLRARRRQHEAGAAALDRAGARGWSSSPRRSRSAAACSRSAPCSTWCGPRCCRSARSPRSTTPTASPSCRWAWSASPSARRCCRCWPASCAPARPDAAMANQNRAIEFGLLLSLPGGAGAVAAGRSDHPRAVRARPLRPRRHLAHRGRARRLRRRPARLRAGQGADARLLRPRGHARRRSTSRSRAIVVQHRAQRRLPLRHRRSPRSASRSPRRCRAG